MADTKQKDKPGTDLVAVSEKAVEFVENPRLQAELGELLPVTVSRATFSRALKNAIITDPTGKLVKAEPVSLFQAALRCAMDGLLPDGRDAVILPFWDSKERKNRAQYIQMIGGQKRIAGEYGWMLDARVVRENDQFDPDVENHRANFKPAKLGTDRGEIIGVYAIAEHRDGRKVGPVIMDMKDIGRVRAKSKQPNGQLWTEWFDRACEKTAAKQVMKAIPWDSKDRDRVMRAIERDDELEGDIDATTMLYGAAPQPAAPAAPSESQSDDDDGPIDVDGEEITDADGEPEAAPSPAQPGPEEAAEASPADDDPSPAGDAAPFEGEEPPEEAVEEPRFESGRYGKEKHPPDGLTPSEVLALGEKGVTYLQWAFKNWKTPAMRECLDRLAEQHPEIKG